MSSSAASASPGEQSPHAAATRSANRDSFAPPAAVKNRALRLPGSATAASAIKLHSLAVGSPLLCFLD